MSGRLAETQREYLVNFMEKNPKLAKNHMDNTFTKEKAKKQWQELADALNALGGALKTVKQWKRTWTDLKMLSKKKAAAKRRSATKTGGGVASSSDDEEILTEKFEDDELSEQLSSTAPGPSTGNPQLQDRILSIIGETVVDGIKGVRELGLDQFIGSDSENETQDGPGHQHKRPNIDEDLKNPSSKKKTIKSKKELTAEWLNNSKKKVEATEKVADALNNIAAQLGRIAHCFEIYNNSTI